jgi:hypothetical protein
MPATVLFGVAGGWAVVSILTLVVAKCRGAHDETCLFICRVASSINFAFFFLFEFAFLCGRMHFLLGAADQFEPQRTPEHKLVYTGPAYFSGSNATEVRAAGCDMLVDASGQLKTLVPAESDVCELWFLKFSARLLTTGWQKFSVGLGLAIFALLSFGCCFGEVMVSHRTVWWHEFGLYFIFLIICSQQSMVLMPLTSMTPTNFCLQFSLPSGLSIERTICLWQYSAAGIPFGIPLMLGGIGALAIAAGSNESSALKGGAGLVGICIFGLGLALFGCWLVIGIGWGVWVHFANITVRSTVLFLVAEMLAPALFKINAVLNRVSSRRGD